MTKVEVEDGGELEALDFCSIDGKRFKRRIRYLLARTAYLAFDRDGEAQFFGQEKRAT